MEISSTLAREAGVDELAEQREPFLEVPVVFVKMIIVVVLEPCHGPKTNTMGWAWLRHDEDEMRQDLKPVNRNGMGISSKR